MGMNENVFVQTVQDGFIVSLDPIDTDLSDGLQASHEILQFQLLCEKPVLVVCAVSDEYPELYPGTLLVPESLWMNIALNGSILLMNEVFIEKYLRKSIIEVSLSDLLSTFEILTDSEILTHFSDEHGLIIGALNASI